MRRPAMTTDEAITFDGFSMANATLAAHALRATGACHANCQPYADIFTYRRWLAQGQQVQKGQHGARLAIIVETQPGETDADGTEHPPRRLCHHTSVFCRCQVHQKESPS